VGVATCTTSYAGVSTHSITAVYSGDANFTNSTSAPLTQTINQDATTTSLSSSVNPSVIGQSVTFTATVTANGPGAGTPTGTVTFQDPGVDIPGCVNVPLVAGTATCTTTFAGPGSFAVTAIYSGDADFLGSTSAALTELVLPGLPNTSGPQAAHPPAKPNPPAGTPDIWLAILAVIAGGGGLFIVAARLRRWRTELSAVSAVVVLSIGVLGVGQLVAPPAAGPTSSTAAADPEAGTQPIGSRVVTVAKPISPSAKTFHAAEGQLLPSRLRIPSISVDAPVVEVGLLSDGTMDVPGNLWTAAWLANSALPGQPGSSVIAGHRGIGTPAVFSHLENVRAGDMIFVSDAAGGELVYQATRVVSLDLSAATQVEVFGPIAQSQLVLVTCVGKYSSRTGTYDHRLVVFARLLAPPS
jgi:LPXTG-site transpeptidase (sortase) family protein